ncbi:MAG: nickel/cobalt transporter [Gaiella sp.]
MRRLLVSSLLLALAVVAALARPSGAAAHPLGNFTVNHYSGLEIAGDTVYVRQVLDLAEIPTFQIGDQVRARGYAARLAGQLVLRINGRRVPLAVRAATVEASPGAGGLETLRFEAIYAAPATGGALTFADRSFPGRIGWREITAAARDGATLQGSAAPVESVSARLRAYPDDRLRSPLDVRSVAFSFTAGPGGAVAPTLKPPTVATDEHAGSGFESLIAKGELSFGVVLAGLAIALFWGAVHALTPGHGKALVAGYLIGTRGRVRDAFLLGATVTITHTAGVFVLGFVTLALSSFIVPETLYPWITLISGVLVVAVGAAVLCKRLRSGGWQDHSHDHDDLGLDDDGHGRDGESQGHSHDHHTGHGHDHGHHHHAGGDHGHHHHHHDHHAGERHDDGADRLERRGVIGVGIAAGLLPCPSALVVLLSAIALHRVGFGLALIVAFSFGLAATITGIGLVAVLARRAFGRARLDGPLVRALPAVSAAVILAVGLVLTVRAIPAVV